VLGGKGGGRWSPGSCRPCMCGWARIPATEELPVASLAVFHATPRPSARRATLKKRAADVLAYFDRPGTSNGPTEAINGRLEHLRGSALGFRNLTNYIARSLLETGGFSPDPRARLSRGVVSGSVPRVGVWARGLRRSVRLFR